MPSKTTAAETAATGATKGARNRAARRAAKPAPKAAWLVGKKIVKRKARTHARRYGDVAGAARSAALIYGPMAAGVLGVVEQLKHRRRFPAVLAGIAVAGGLVYLAGGGPDRLGSARNGHDPPRAARHLRLAALTGARAEIGPANLARCIRDERGHPMRVMRAGDATVSLCSAQAVAWHEGRRRRAQDGGPR